LNPAGVMDDAAKQNMVEESLRSVAVIGAGGKMGNGIALVLLQAMARLDAQKHGVPGSGAYELVLIDQNHDGLKRLKEYLRGQMLKFAEKRIVFLRECARGRKDLVENGEIVEAFVDGAMSMVLWDIPLESARSAKLVFEAVFEDLAVKEALYTRLKAICPPDAFFFSNTSSIPISALDHHAGLDGRIIGYHFYNPPAVQKLVEVITSTHTRPELAALGGALGKTLEKILVPSHDIAGFIGNGHFIREGLFALRRYRELRKNWEDYEALFIINKVTQDFLLRPMGIFQLLDYVGIDVFQMILRIMARHLPLEDFTSVMVDELLHVGVKGGQAGSGEQKDGFCKYERNKIAAIYRPDQNQYVPLAEKDKFAKCLAWLGTPPALPGPAGGPGASPPTWSALAKDAHRQEKMAAYFPLLFKDGGHGAGLAREFLLNSRRIAENLVNDRVAASQEDVTAVLVNGFFHLYGPVNSLY
jgi:3-hydroxyacyl-CoA dehydrogenase